MLIATSLYFFHQNKYRAKGVEAFKEYSVVTDTPVYETAKQNAQNLSDVSDSLNVLNNAGSLLSIFHYATKNHDHTSFFLLFFQLHYRYDYNANVKGTNTAPAVTIETERARLANYIQSDVRSYSLIFRVLV